MKFDLSQADAYNETATRTSSDVDSRTISFQLTELQRVALIALSADTATGGDAGNTPAVLDLAELGVRDLATNKNNFGTIVLDEVADTIKPVIVSATIDLDQPAVLVITASEILDSTPSSNVNPSALRLSDDPGDAANGAVVLTDSAVTEGGMGAPFPGSTGVGAPFEIVDDYKVRLTLTEADRALAIAISGTSGGNGVAGRSWTPRTCKDTGKQYVGDASNSLAFTGTTGNTFTAAKCVGGSAASDHTRLMQTAAYAPLVLVLVHTRLLRVQTAVTLALRRYAKVRSYWLLVDRGYLYRQRRKSKRGWRVSPTRHTCLGHGS